MKKLIVFIVFFQLCSFVTKAQTPQASITCSIKGGNDRTIVSLFHIQNSTAVKLEERKPDASMTVSFTVDLNNEGIYFVSPGASHGNIYKNGIYLKPGDRVKLTGYVDATMNLDFEKFEQDNPNFETDKLNSWLNKFAKFVNDRTFTKSFDFYSEYAKLEEFATILTKIKTSNKYFNEYLKDLISTDLYYLKAGNFFQFNILTKTPTYDTAAAVQPFYKSLDNAKILSSTAPLNSTRGFEMMKYLLSYQAYKKGIAYQSFFDYTPMINNDLLKAWYLVKFFDKVATQEMFARYVEPNGKCFSTEELKELFSQKQDAVTKYLKGVPGLNFTLKDVNGKVYTLEDFRGKVVVINLWFAAANTNLGERAAFKKAEEDCKTTRPDVVFISVAQNKLYDLAVWKKILADDNHKGMELIDTESRFRLYYNFKVPNRFMIFDKEGNVFSIEAPPPTSPDFKKTIEKALAVG
ncbi:hypothetical protein C3K47_04270 [Solitalea longa]|uniref:Thioredoxin domain-containing protein n=1 Tax=Solitalea longa TaxID=2079460 RepID=A0A2S5A8N3_9SPHI|nr:redoxin family protein [Solitalea longa]POY38617.1 hypothetical protein C3K47_04270 [Solitalea longa]